MSMLQKLQQLGQKAAQIKAAVDKAPETVASLRQTLQMTAGQIHQARVDLTDAASGLRVESEEDFAEVLREISSSVDTFREAGYELTGVDIEASQWHRLMLEFHRIAAVPEATLKYLLARHTSGVSVSSILSAFVKAEALAESSNVAGMEYNRLIVHAGAAPAIRLCWRSKSAIATAPVRVASAPETPALQQPSAGTVAATQSAALKPTSTFAPSSYFESSSRPAAETATAGPMHIHPAAPAAPQPGRSRYGGVKALGSNWKQEALDRLKSAPGESKYSR